MVFLRFGFVGILGLRSSEEKVYVKVLWFLCCKCRFENIRLEF